MSDLKITQLIAHHNDESIAKIDKQYKKSEILKCLNDSAWQYSTAKEKADKLEKEAGCRVIEVNMAKRMILSFIGKNDLEKDQWGHDREAWRDADLMELLAELFSIADKDKVRL